MRRLKLRLLQSFKRCEDGVVAVEMAIAAIILTTLVMGGFEAARAVLLEQKLDRASTTLSDLAARAETLNATQLNDLYSATKDIMSPFDLNAKGVVYLTVVTGTGTATPATPTITWQKKLGGLSNATSTLGATGTAKLPTGFTLNKGESVIVAEVYYTYQPVFTADMFALTNLYQSSYSRPRLVDYPVLN